MELAIDYRLMAKAQEFYSEKVLLELSHLPYFYTDVPYWADYWSLMATKPQSLDSAEVEGRFIPPSGEQCFLTMVETTMRLKRGAWDLEKLFDRNPRALKLMGRHFAITPCFRSFDPDDETHSKQFMKLELFIPFVGDAPKNRTEEGFSNSFQGKFMLSCLDQMVQDAEAFLSSLNRFRTFRVKGTIDEERTGCETLVSRDIVVDTEEYGELELGSYGIRRMNSDFEYMKPEWWQGKEFYWIYGTGLALPRTQLIV